MRLLMVVICLCFLICSCEPVGKPDQSGAASLAQAKLSVLEAIPAEFGSLVAVTTHAQYEGWSQLWFVDHENTVRMVRVQFEKRRVGAEVLVIPRS